MNKEKNVEELKKNLMEQLRKDLEAQNFDHALACVRVLKRLEKKE